MTATQSVLDLIAEAQANAKVHEARIAQTRNDAGDDLRTAATALEAEAINIVSVFEARLQHHFRRGPFSKKLRALLLDAGQKNIADKLHQYYLAINVLKHGKGASYRELLNTPSALFDVKIGEIPEDALPTASLIDISKPGFFEGLTTTLSKAHDFLESRPTS